MYAANAPMPSHPLFCRLVVPHPCQNERKTAVASGHSRTPRTASDLGSGRLTRCVKHTSKQRVRTNGGLAATVTAAPTSCG